MAAKAPVNMFPKFDDAVFKSFFADNMAVAIEAQRLMLDATEAMVGRQLGLMREALDTFKTAATGFDVNKKPEDYVAEAKAAAERAQAAVKTEVETGMKVQKQLADLVSKRVSANVEQAKTLAA